MSAAVQIIHQPHLLHLGRRVVYLGIALTFWGLWLYLVAPLATMTTTAFGLEAEIGLETEVGFFDSTLAVYMALAAVPSVLLVVVWSFIRLFAAQGRGERLVAPVTAAATAYGLDFRAVQLIQRSARMVFHFHDDGALAQVDADTEAGEAHFLTVPRRRRRPSDRDSFYPEAVRHRLLSKRDRWEAMDAVFGGTADTERSDPPKTRRDAV